MRRLLLTGISLCLATNLVQAQGSAGAPVITSSTSANGTIGSAFSYQITATNSPTSYGATGLPAGLTVNTTTGLISGTPSAAGNSSVTISATSSGGTGNGNLNLSITEDLKIEVTTLAGSQGSTDGNGTDPLVVNVTTLGGTGNFSNPRGVAVDAGGNVYVADYNNHRIRKISPSGNVTTLAGTGFNSYLDGQGSGAHFNYPFGVSLDGNGTVYVTDQYNNRIRKITPSGNVTTLAGSGTRGFADGNGTEALFDYPSGVAVDGSGNVYVAGNNRIRKITPSGAVTTLAGGGGPNGFGFADGNGTAASFSTPTGVAVDGSGTVYVADSGNHRIRKITPSGMVSTLAGSGMVGFADGPGTAASFRNPTGVAVDGVGNVYVADRDNHRIRMITPGGRVTTLAGTGNASFADGNATLASFQSPFGVAVDSRGVVYVADQSNNRIRKITIGPKITIGGVILGTLPDIEPNQPYSLTLGITNTISTGTGNWSISQGSLPPGLSLNATTGTLSGTPTSLGIFQFRILLQTGGLSDEIDLRQNVVLPRIIGLSGNLSFGNTPTDQNPQRVLTLTNSGTGNLTVRGITYPGGFSGNWSGLIAPGGSQNVIVTFSPTAVQSYSGNLVVISDATSGSAERALSGTGIPSAPVITSELAANGVLGNIFSYQINALHNATSYAATGLPTGMTVNSSTGLIGGIPGAAGNFTLTISATNSVGTKNATLALAIRTPVLRAADYAGNYPNGWNAATLNGWPWESGPSTNGGFGFEPWALEVNQTPGSTFAGAFLGNPASVGFTGLGSAAFGLYANRGAFSTWEASIQAIRKLGRPLEVGETLRFKWAVNWDGDRGEFGKKGFTILRFNNPPGSPNPPSFQNSGLNVNMSGNSTITINGMDTGFGYGTKAMVWTIERLKDKGWYNTPLYRVSATDRDGVGQFSIELEDLFVDAIGFYASNMAPGAEREPYFNDLEVVETAGPLLSVSPQNLSGLTTSAGTPSAPASVQITGVRLESDVVVSLSSAESIISQTDWLRYEVSLGNGPYAKSVTIPRSSGNVSATLNIRIAGSTGPGNLLDSFLHVTSQNATSRICKLNGNVQPIMDPAISIVPETLTPFTVIGANASEFQTVQFTGNGLYHTVNAEVDWPFEIDEFPFGAPNLAPSWFLSASWFRNQDGTAAGTAGVRLRANLISGNYSGNLTFESTDPNSPSGRRILKRVPLSGSVSSAVLSTTPRSLQNFTAHFGSASAAQSITINGTSLLSNISVWTTNSTDGWGYYSQRSSAFELSTDNRTFSGNLTIANTGGNASARIFVRMSAAASERQAPTGQLVISATGAETQLIPLSGNDLPTFSLSAYSLGNLQSFFGKPSTSQWVGLSGGALTGPVTITAPEGFEVSTDNSTFFSSVQIPPPIQTIQSVYRTRPKSDHAMIPVQGGYLTPNSWLSGTQVSTFQIGKFEVTWEEWSNVRIWALENGYTDLEIGQGSAGNHPVRNISWYDVVKWCNARSEKEGLIPVYNSGLNIYRTGREVPTINSSANGYRLPTLAEWQWAARGGSLSKGYSYSGSNDLDSVAWYQFNSGGAVVALNGNKGTWPVGQKAANELGIHDMSGNVAEWIWQIGSGFVSSTFNGGSYRGGSFDDWVGNLDLPTGNSILERELTWSSSSKGFRLARNLSPAMRSGPGGLFGDYTTASGNIWNSGSGNEFPNGAAFAGIDANGGVRTWGPVSHGGNASLFDDYSLEELDSVQSRLTANVSAIYSTSQAYAALKKDGSVVTWGGASFGGDSSSVASKLMGNVTAVYSNEAAFAALKSDGSVVTWGSGRNGGNSSIFNGYNELTTAPTIREFTSDQSIYQSITIPSQGAATPSSSKITVAGLGRVSGITLKINGLTHSRPQDLKMWLNLKSSSQLHPIDFPLLQSFRPQPENLSGDWRIAEEVPYLNPTMSTGGSLLLGNYSWYLFEGIVPPGADLTDFYGGLDKNGNEITAGALQTGRIADGGYIYFQNWVRGPGTVSFWTKVSSQPGGDRFFVELDGQEVSGASWSGEVPWSLQSVQVPQGGLHRVRWVYSKNNSGSMGKDAAWLSLIRFTPRPTGVNNLSITFDDSSPTPDTDLGLVSSGSVTYRTPGAPGGVTNWPTMNGPFASAASNPNGEWSLNVKDDYSPNGGSISSWSLLFYEDPQASDVRSLLRSGVAAIYSTKAAFAALKTDGSVVTWGSSEHGGNSQVMSGDVSLGNMAGALSSNVTAIYSNAYAFAALKKNGSVVSWGDAEYGGKSSGFSFSQRLESGVAAIYSTNYAFAALKSDGSVVTWGDNDLGGNSNSVASSLSSNVTALYSNEYAFAALKSNGSVVTWGSPSAGGDSSSVAGNLTSNVTAVYSTANAFAALKRDGSVVTWGEPRYGGNATVATDTYSSGEGGWRFFSGTNYRSVEAGLTSNVTAIYSNVGAFAALKSNGSVVTWGNEFYGGNSTVALGSDFNFTYQSVAEHLSSNVTSIYATADGFTALKKDGTVVAWGSGGSDPRFTDNVPPPTAAPKLPSGIHVRVAPGALSGNLSGNIRFSSSGVETTLSVNATVRPLTSSAANLSGFSSAINKFSSARAFSLSGGGISQPITISAPSGFEVSTDNRTFASTIIFGKPRGSIQSVYRGEFKNHTGKIWGSGSGQEFPNMSSFAAITSNGSVVAWGGYEDGGNSYQVDALLSSRVKAIYSNHSAFAALRNDGSVVTWGHGPSGGNSSAVADNLTSNVTAVYSTSSALAALKNDGSVVTWGDGLGGGNSSAVAGSLTSNVTAIYSTNSAFAALRNDGSVVTWGHGPSGGNSSTVAGNLSSNVSAIYSTSSAFAALRNDGSVVTWGHGPGGGNSSTVAGNLTSNVTAVYSNDGAFAALKKDGSVISWGSRVGYNFLQVAAKLSSNVTAVHGTDTAFAALKRDGSVITWGADAYGGDSSAVAGSLSSNVTAIYSNRSAFAALKSDGSVVTWGYGPSGGNSSIANYHSRNATYSYSNILNGSITSNVKSIFSNAAAFAALKNDGSVVTWGDSTHGGNSSVGENSGNFFTPYTYTNVSERLATNIIDVYSTRTGFAALKKNGSVVTWGTPESYLGGGSFRNSPANIGGGAPPELPAIVYVRMAPKSSGGVVSGNIAIHSDSTELLNVPVEGEVIGSIQTSVTALAGFYAIQGNASSSQSLTVEGSGLGSAITVQAPEGYEVAAGAGTFGPTATISQSQGVAAGSLRVRLSAQAWPGTVSGEITISAFGATLRSVALGGVVEPTPPPPPLPGQTQKPAPVYPTLIGTSDLSGLIGTDGSPSNTSKPFAFEAFAIEGMFDITAPSGFQLSTDNSTFTDRVSAYPGTLYARLAPGTPPGIHTGHVTISNSSGIKQVMTVQGLIQPVLTVLAANGEVQTNPSGTLHPPGTTLSLTATPANGFEFTGWSGALSGRSNPASLVLNDSSTVQANFAPVFQSNTLSLQGLNFQRGGDALWFTHTGNLPSGATVGVRSGNITHGRSSHIETTVQGPGTLSFWLKVSSEGGADRLLVTLNGMEIAGADWSGEVQWTQHSVEVPSGSHTVRWVYSKDSSESLGDDAAYLALVNFSQGIPQRLLSIDPTTGTVSATPQKPSYDLGETVSLVAVPPIGGEFIAWSGSLEGRTNPASLAMTESRVVSANFAPAFHSTLLGPSGLVFQRSGEGRWFLQTAEAPFGATYAASSRFTPSGGSADLEAVVSGPGTLAYWVKAPMVPGAGRLLVTVNGTQVGPSSDSEDWIRESVAIPAGNHTVRWRFENGDSFLNAVAAAYLANISFSSGSGFTGWSNLGLLPSNRRGMLDRNGPQNLPNLLAYAMGLNPLTATAADLPFTGNFNAAARTIDFTYRRAKNLSDVSLTVEGSSSLTSGFTSATVASEAVLLDGADHQTIRATISVPAGATRYFLRLRATKF